MGHYDSSYEFDAEQQRKAKKPTAKLVRYVCTNCGTLKDRRIGEDAPVCGTDVCDGRRMYVYRDHIERPPQDTGHIGQILLDVALPPLSVEEMRIRQYAEVPVPGAPTTVRPTLKQLAEFALAVMQLYAETERPTDANMADVENLAIEHNLLNEYGEVPLVMPEEPAPGVMVYPLANIHISESKSVAVSQDRYWQPMETCPRGVKVALLNPGKVAVFGQSHGHGGEPWLGWDPLPKVPDWMK